MIIGADFDFASRTLDLFETGSEENSLTSLDREDLLWRDDRRWVGDAVISFSASGLAFGGTWRETSVRLASESRMLNGGTFDKLSTSCIRLVTCSSSEESSIVMLLFGKDGVLNAVSEFISSWSRATLEIVAVLRFSSHCKNCSRSLELSLCWKGNSSIS